MERMEATSTERNEMTPMTGLFGEAEVWNVDLFRDGRMVRGARRLTHAAAAALAAELRAVGESAWAVCDEVAL